MRIIAAIAGALLGLLFLFAAAAFFFKLMDGPAPAEGSPMAAFFTAFGPTGYLTFVKVLEAVGGVLVALPWTRRLGLLILGPIIVNILAFHVFITGGHGLLDPMILVMVALTLVLVWCERAAFAPFLPGRSAAR
jgi:hypothetical protein